MKRKHQRKLTRKERREQSIRLAAEIVAAMFDEMDSHHGMTGTPEWQAYKSARTRCRNKRDKDYARYGKRGIRFLYKSFKEFFHDLGPRPTPEHSLDRRDNDGPYAPGGQCHWATKSEQARNRRKPTKKVTSIATTKTKKAKAA